MKGSSIILHNSQNWNLSNEEFFRDINDDKKFDRINYDDILIFKLSIVVVGWGVNWKGLTLSYKGLWYVFCSGTFLEKSNVICFEDVTFVTGSVLIIIDLQLIHKHI